MTSADGGVPGPTSAAGRVYAEYLKLCQDGEDPSFEAVCADHPDLRTALLELHQAEAFLRAIRRTVRRASTAGPRPGGDREDEPAVARDGPDGRAETGAALGPSSDTLRRLAERAPSSRYRIKDRMAHGGMGSILLVRDGDLRRDLAMKVIRGHVPDLSASSDGDVPVELAESDRTEPDPLTIRRFLEEAQVTSQLDHPGIVPVHEIGMDRNGRLYFTMKLVEGQDLGEVFARVAAGEPDWTVPRVIGALLKVCEAMAYAHDKGVIHRDLKPSNVMVGPYGEVYVMDWGLAKVLGEPEVRDMRLRPEDEDAPGATDERRTTAPGAPVVTMDGDVVGTPAYMSPEQALGRLDRLSPAADVYSVGAMLYHLLTGRMPYSSPGVVRTNYEILKSLRKHGPTPVRELAPHVPAELAAICERAIERKIGRRYPGMMALSDDLRAYLENRVVAAYETGRLAKLRKWVARNKFLSAALCAVGASIVGGLVVTLVLLAELSDEVRQTRAVRDIFWRTMSEVDPRSRGKDALLIDALRKGSRLLEDDFEGNDLNKASLYDMFGTTAHYLGWVDEAVDWLRFSVEIRQRELGSESLDTLTAQHSLAMALDQAGMPAETLSLVESYLPVLERLHPDDETTYSARVNYAGQLQDLGRWEEAGPLLELSVELFGDRYGFSDERTLTVLNSWARQLSNTEGRRAEGRLLFEEIVRKRTQIRGETHYTTLTSEAFLALVYWGDGEHERATDLLADVVDRMQVAIGADHPMTIRYAGSVAAMMEALGRTEEAERRTRATLDACRAKLGASHPVSLTLATDLALSLANRSRFEEALEVAREVNQLWRSLGPPENAHDFRNSVMLAFFASRVGEHAEALSVLEGSLEARRRRPLYVDTSLEPALVLHSLILLDADPDRSAAFFDEAMAIVGGEPIPRASNLGQFVHLAALAHEGRGNPQRAAELRAFLESP